MGVNQDLLDEEVGTPPPTSLDVEAIIARQRWRIRSGRAGLSAMAVVATAGVALIVAAALPADGRNANNADVGAHPSSPASKASPTATATPTLSIRDVEAARLSRVLQQHIAQLLPHATLLADPKALTLNGNPSAKNPPEAPLVFVDVKLLSGKKFFFATAKIVQPAGTGGIAVTVGQSDSMFATDRACPPRPLDSRAFECQVKPGPDGGSMMILSNSYGDAKLITVDFIRPDGNGVAVQVLNAPMGEFQSGQTVTFMPTTPLTKDQLIALVELPDLATSLR